MKTKLYISLFLLFSLSGCNNWLDVELDNKVDDNKLFSTTDGFKEALAGVYSELAKPMMYGKSMTMEYTDLLARYYLYNSVQDRYEYWKDYNYVNSSSKGVISGYWNNLYSNISQVNCILEWADKNSGVLSETDRNQIRGEALALRAYLHFDLYRMFSPDAKRSPKANGIPYNKEFGVSLPPMYSVEEVMQLIINDLKEAEICLANDPIIGVIPYAITTSTNDGEIVDAAAKDKADQYVARMNLYSVKAMLARVYQARGEYTNAITKAKEVIESKKFRLLDFKSIDQSEKTVDLLFSDELIFGLRNKKINTYSQVLHKDNTSHGVTQLTPLPFANVSSMYESNNDDARYAKWFNLGKLIKFMPDSASVYPQKMPMIKLSEMYLLITECLFSSDPTTALQYINELRDHRIRNNAHWTYLTKEYIYEEMRREYVGEGQLWYVYKRNNLKLPGDGVNGEIEPSDLIFVFPLPDAEVEDGHRTQR
ncbi:MAG: RagB/SusD family nutrient uptake outer membrane protein [Odoribacter sp.]